MPTIRLSWADLNSGSINETSYNVYRSASPFTDAALPPVLATVIADSTGYDDTTAATDTVYYYMVEAVGVGVSAFSSLATITVGAGGGGGTGTYEVPVPSGKVDADLTDFPLMIDLADMPASFWANVQDDGGNIRAYAADGVTLIPHDVTYTNTTRQRGRMYVSRTLLSAAAVAVQIKTIASPASKLLPADPNGRNAVWAAYEAVFVFPEDVNRVGNGLVQDLSGLEEHTVWIRNEYYDALAGSPHQGVATDSAGTFITIDTDYLRKYTGGLAGTPTATNATPLADTGIALVDHIGDGCIIGSELFLPVEKYPNSPYDNQHIAVFNVSDLSFNRSYDISTQAHEVSSICTDGTHLYITDYITTTKIHKYTLAGAFVESITLSAPIVQMQGIEFVDGVFLVNTNGEDLYEVQVDGTVNGIVYIDPHLGAGEGLTYDGTSLYVLEADGDLPVMSRDKHEDYRRSHYAFNNPASVTMPLSTTWTAAATIFPTTAGVQFAYLGVANGTSQNNSEALLFDKGPNRFDVWNSSDSWIAPSPGVNPASYTDYRIAFAHDGASARKLIVDGTLAKEEVAGVTARPAGSGDMEFVIGASRPDGSEDCEAYFQSVWFRKEYMSAAWMKADADNTLSPATFYGPIVEI